MGAASIRDRLCTHAHHVPGGGGGIRALSLYYGRDTTYTRSWVNFGVAKKVNGEVDLQRLITEWIRICEFLNRKYDINIIG